MYKDANRMNAKFLSVAFIAVVVCLSVALVMQQRYSAALAMERSKNLEQIAAAKSELNTLQEKLTRTEQERDKLKADAAEVHKLRGELSTLRKAKDDLEKKAAAQQARVAPKPEAPPTPTPPAPAAFSNYAEVAQFAEGLRTKTRSGVPLTAEETAWLQQAKPELEKLEASPESFAAFQASMIQATAGITDPQKVERIQQAIQKVYQNAVARGLNLQSRPQDDASWVQQRHQLDRRGTTAVQTILSPEERAAFDRSFLGIMGVDLGTGVDKSLYPPGFLGDPVPRTQ
jgi:hypothetical protein